jgi:hypothetical protein
MNERMEVGMSGFGKGLISGLSDDKIEGDAFSGCRNVDLTEKGVPMSINGSELYAELPEELESEYSGIQGGIIYNNKDIGQMMVVASGGGCTIRY